MNITQKYCTRNDCYKAGRAIQVQGLMLHSIGTSQPSAAALANYYNQPGISACVHAFIDANTGDVIQTLPWNHRGWHAGGKANNTHIGVEMCEPDAISYTGGDRFTVKDASKALAAVRCAYNSAVQLFAQLCKQFGLDPLQDGVIISHREGHQRGVASGHSDPWHLWTQTGSGYDMDGFRRDVKAAMGGAVTPAPSQPQQPDEAQPLYRIRKSWQDAESQIGAYHNLDYAKAACKDGYTVYDENGGAVYPAQESSPAGYLVRVTARSGLNVRSGPGTDYKIVMAVGFGGAYTITQEKNGWGKLKSGVGWICLKYTERIR